VAADQALAVSLMKTGQIEKARELVNYGLKNSGQYASLYQQMLDELATLGTGSGPASNAPVQGSPIPR